VVNPQPGTKPLKVNWSDNPWFPDTLRREMEHLKQRDPDSYEHVYEGMCKQVVDGAIYRAELIATEKEQRICRVPYDRAHPVHTFWDLGFGDNTSIWFVQTIGFEFRLIDFVNGSQQGLQFYLQELQKRAYVFGTHYLPHDAVSPMLAAGRTIQEQLRSVFPGKVTILPRLSIADGIAAARAIFPRCWFDAQKCADGLQALRHYRYETDEKLGTFKRDPLHDWASHPADAFRYFAVAIREPQRKREADTKATRRTSPHGWMS
jgi:phage terminase large subunit